MAEQESHPETAGAPEDRLDISRARDCHLVEEDGSRWKVVDVEITRSRIWVTARPQAADGPLRIFDTVLTPGTRLTWTFPDGGRLEASLAEPGGQVHWERHPPFLPDEFRTRRPEDDPRDSDQERRADSE